MKIKSISLNNFAKYSSVSVSFDENINWLIGGNGAGKTTLGLNGIWALFQGVALKAGDAPTPLIAERFRIIGPNGATSKNEMVLVDELNGNAEIKVIRKITKTGSDLSFVAPEDYPHVLDQQWLNNLFNIFLIAPKKFLDLSGPQQSQALGINTTAFDQKVSNLKTEYTGLNAVYKSFGEIVPVEETKEVDVAELQAKKKIVDEKLMEQYKTNKFTNKATMEAFNLKCQAIQLQNQEFNKQQDELSQNISMAKDWSEGLGNMGCPTKEVDKWIDEQRALQQPLKRLDEGYPLAPMTPTEIKLREAISKEYPEGYVGLIEEMPDKTESDELQKKIVEASETNRKALLYTQYLAEVKKKEAKAAEMMANRVKLKAAEQEKIDYIKGFKFPFTNLTVDDDGGLLLDGRPINSAYYSTGELLKVIPILISTTKPELKYIFLQEFNLLDDEKQKDVLDFLTGKGYQLVIEMVGKEKIDGNKSILLRDNGIVESFEEEAQGEALEA